jgi:hypothetical protein
MNDKTKPHFERYQHLKSFASRYEKQLTADLDWHCVILFYAALHLLDCYLSTKTNIGFAVDSHPLRNKAIGKCPELNAMRVSYRGLQDLSEQVRYDPGFVFRSQDHQNCLKGFHKTVSVLEPKVKRIVGI